MASENWLEDEALARVDAEMVDAVVVAHAMMFHECWSGGWLDGSGSWSGSGSGNVMAACGAVWGAGIGIGIGIGNVACWDVQMKCVRGHHY